MNALSEYFPLLLILIFLIISIRKGMDRKKQEEETAKTLLPGRESEGMATAEEFTPVRQAREATKKSQSRVSKPPEQPKRFPTESSSSISKDHDSEEESIETVLDLDIDDMDEIKKAVVYTEIFNRKAL